MSVKGKALEFAKILRSGRRNLGKFLYKERENCYTTFVAFPMIMIQMAKGSHFAACAAARGKSGENPAQSYLYCQHRFGVSQMTQM